MTARQTAPAPMTDREKVLVTLVVQSNIALIRATPTALAPAPESNAWSIFASMCASLGLYDGVKVTKEYELANDAMVDHLNGRISLDECLTQILDLASDAQAKQTTSETLLKKYDVGTWDGELVKVIMADEESALIAPTSNGKSADFSKKRLVMNKEPYVSEHWRAQTTSTSAH